MTRQAKDLSFKTNWNNKLNCNAFTTIRLSEYWRKGDSVNIILKGVLMAKGDILDVKGFTIDKLNSFISYLDSGYDIDEFKKIIKTMYKEKNIDWTKQKLKMLLIVKTENFMK